MSQNKPDLLRDQIWQFIGVALAVVFGLLSLLIATVTLPDPSREIWDAIIIIIFALLCLSLYIFFKKNAAAKNFSRREKISIAGIICAVCIAVSLILRPVIISSTPAKSKSVSSIGNTCMTATGSNGNASNFQVGDTYCIYRGHKGAVNAIAWSPDGKRIASAGSDGTVQVWDAMTGGNVVTYRGHKGAVNAVAWSPDGKRIASGGADGTVQIWLSNTGDRISSYNDLIDPSLTNKKPSPDPVLDIAWSPDGYNIVASWESGGIEMIVADEDNGNPPTLLYTEKDTYRFVWSPDSKRIAFGWSNTSPSYDHGAIEIWDVNANKSILNFRARGFDITALDWSPDGRVITTASDATEADYGWVETWDATTGNKDPYVKVPIYFSYTSVIALNWACDNKHIALGSVSGEVEIWDSATNKYFLYRGHIKDVIAALWSPDGTRIASAGIDGTVQVWKASEKPLCTV